MSVELVDAWRTIVPRKDDPHGPLPPLLVSLTVVTGLVDAFSYLTLGHVFVANMTGNVVFLAFALAGATGFSATASALALGSFALGSLLGGRLHASFAAHRGRLLAVATALQVVLVIAALVVRLAVGPHGSTIAHDSLIFLLASTMGLQNAAVRKLAVPDLTTTVLTQTTTAIFSDARLVGGPGSKAGRRVVSILAMFVGALIGSELVLHASSALTLLVALLLLVGVTLAAGVLSRHRASWAVSESA